MSGVGTKILQGTHSIATPFRSTLNIGTNKLLIQNSISIHRKTPKDILLWNKKTYELSFKIVKKYRIVFFSEGVYL